MEPIQTPPIPQTMESFLVMMTVLLLVLPGLEMEQTMAVLELLLLILPFGHFPLPHQPFLAQP